MTDDVRASANQVENQTKRINKSISGIKSFVAKATAGLGLFKLGQEAIQVASNIQEVQNVVDVAFGDMAWKAEKFAKTAITQFGMSELSAKKTASTYMAMAKSMGINEQASSDMAINLAKLSGDVASFFNISQELADVRLKSVFTGETETLKELGVVMTQANLQQFAYSQGINKNIRDMSQAEITTLRYRFVMESLAMAQGDFARTSGSWANQIRLLKEQWKQLLGIIGDGLISVLTPVIQVINAVISKIISFANIVSAVFGKLFGKGGGKKKSPISSMNDDAKNASKSIGGVGKSLDKAGSKAKKAAKEAKGFLAGFDDLNIMTSSNSESGANSGGSSGVGGGAGYDVGSIDWSEEPDTSGIDKAVDKIINKVEMLRVVLGSVWNSAPVQAFVSTSQILLQFIYDFVISITNMLWENLKVTWSNIQLDVQNMFKNIFNLWTLFWKDLGVIINQYALPIIEGITNLFDSIWKDAIDPLIQNLVKRWSDFTRILLDLWTKYGKDILDGIGKFVVNTIGLFQSIWDNIIEPIITPFLEMLSELWDEHIKAMIESVGNFIGKLMIFALDIYNKFIAPIVKGLLEILKPAFSTIGNIVSSVFKGVVGVISDAVKNIMNVLSGIIDFVSGVFTGNWKKAWQGVKNIFSSIVSGLANIFKAPINAIISGINTFIGGLNKIKIPDWVPGVGGYGISIPKIPKLAQGGIVNKATLGIFGEAGTEAVVPLKKNTQGLDMIADKIISRMPINNSNGGTYVINVVLETGERITKKIIKDIKEYEIKTGEPVFDY